MNEQFYSSLVIAAKIAQDLDFTKILYEDMTNFFATRRLVLPMATWSSFMYLISKGEQWSIDYMMGAYNFMRRMDIKPVIGIYDDLLCRCNSEIRESGGHAALMLYHDLTSFGISPTNAIVKYTFEALTNHRQMFNVESTEEHLRRVRESGEMLTLAFQLYKEHIVDFHPNYQSFCAERLLVASNHNLDIGVHALTFFMRHGVVLRTDGISAFLRLCVDTRDVDLLQRVCETFKSMDASLPEFHLQRICESVNQAGLRVDVRDYIKADAQPRGHHYRKDPQLAVRARIARDRIPPQHHGQSWAQRELAALHA